MRYSAVILALLVPSLSVAQDWSVETRVSTGNIVTYSHSGTHVGLTTRDPEGEWLGTDVFVVEGADLSECSKQDALSLDHYYGLDGSYSVNVFAELFRDAGGEWEVVDPAIFFDSLSEDEDIVAAYEGYEATTIKVTSLRCVDDMVAMTLTYSGVLDRYEGRGPDSMKIAGNAAFQVPLKPYEDY